jgi:peptidylprolyl isomerase
MKKVYHGAFVKLCYTGKLENGTVFDKTDKCKPIEVRIGDGSLVDGFENALIGMGLNERKSFILEPEDAYGEWDEKLERRFGRASLQLRFEPLPGQVIVFKTLEGKEIPAVVKFVNDEVIIADFNHPLAGRDLSFDVEVAEISETGSDSKSRCAAECCCAA